MPRRQATHLKVVRRHLVTRQAQTHTIVALRQEALLQQLTHTVAHQRDTTTVGPRQAATHLIKDADGPDGELAKTPRLCNH